MSEDDRLIQAFSNLHKRDAKFFSSFLEYLNKGKSIALGASKSDAAFNFMRRLMRSQLPTYKALRRRLPNGGISKDDYRSFVSNTFELFAEREKITGFERDSRDLAAKSFYATRDGLDPLEYLSGPKDNWVGYDPNSGPLAQRFHELEAVDAQRQFRIRNAGKRKSSLSGIAATDELANLDRINRRLNLLDRLRTFRHATQASGFSRYAQAERASNEDIDRRNRLAAEAESRFRYDTMDEFDQRMHDLTERYNGDTSKAEEVYKKTLQKELPSFFRNSKMSAKDMNRLANAWGEFAESNPMAARLAKNPIMYGGLAAYGALLWGMGKSDAANKSVIAWSNARNIYGSGSSAFQRAAYMAGVEDPGAISRRLGKQAIRYGGSANAESVYREFGSMMSGMTRDEKMYFAESIGFDDTDVAIAEMLAGGMKPSLARKVGANKAMLEAQKMAGFASGAGAGATAKSLWLSIPGMASAQARDLEGWAGTDRARKDAMDSYVSTMSAAIGDDAYSENTSQSGTLTPSVSGGTSVSVHGNIIIENADNAQDVAEGIKNYVDKHTSRLRAATSQDPGAQ